MGRVDIFDLSGAMVGYVDTAMMPSSVYSLSGSLAGYATGDSFYLNSAFNPPSELAAVLGIEEQRVASGPFGTEIIMPTTGVKVGELSQRL